MRKLDWTVIDIETAPKSDAMLEKWLPEIKDWDESMFDPSEVKTGNVKNPDLIKAKIEVAKAKAESDFVGGQEKARQDVIDKAALYPNTGWVFGIGVTMPGETKSVFVSEYEKEPELLAIVWDLVEGSSMIVNHNLLEFDWPFLIARSMARGVSIPFCAWRDFKWSGSEFTCFNSPRPAVLVDTMQVAKNKRLMKGQYHSLNNVADYFNLPKKVDLGDKLPWDVFQEDFHLCKEYTEYDAVLTSLIAERLTIVSNNG